MKAEEKEIILEVVKKHCAFFELPDGRWLFQVQTTLTNPEVCDIIKRFVVEK